MLKVKTIAEVNQLVQARFGSLRTQSELMPIQNAMRRVLSQEIRAGEHVPAFNRSTVDGYALRASDVFGCSETMPALLKYIGEVHMGVPTDLTIQSGQCAYVPTGGELPQGADAMLMLEEAEDFGDGTIAANKPVAPGANLIFRGDDVKPGDLLFSAGKRLNVADIGALAALGLARVEVRRMPHVALISTGDELLPADQALQPGMIHDVNAPMLQAALLESGAQPYFLGIFRDNQTEITKVIQKIIPACDLLILSGGTSVGVKDAIPAAIAELGELIVHGVAAKPGKPTLFGSIDGKAVIGLPGNPMAAYFMFLLLVRPLIASMLGWAINDLSVQAQLEHAVSSNHGREDLLPVSLRNGNAHPLIGKSGLITTLSSAQGFIRIPRDCEGLKQSEQVEVILFPR